MRFNQRTANAIMALAFILLIAGCLFGCKSVEKYKASPDYPADCAKDFPPTFISGKPDTVTLASIVIDCDSVIAANGKADTVTLTNTVVVTRPANRVNCPPSLTITRVDTVISTASLEACQRTLYEERASYQRTIDKMQYDADRLQGKFVTRTKQRNWLVFVILGYLIYYFRHNIIKLFNRK